jgi:VCBS repeat-containing protein
MRDTARTSTKVAAITGAAHDETLGGVTEDQGGTLDVLANDPGSAWLYSLCQDPGAATTFDQFPIVQSAFTSQGGQIAIVDGALVYSASPSMQSLAAGETGLDTFIYTIRMANGALSTATATVVVTGVNDDASISGDDSGSVTEDGTLSTGGTLSVSDVDHGENVFAAVDPDALHGTYGEFTFNAGAWSYSLSNSDPLVQALTSADQVTDTLTVTSLDGTASHDIVVTINGADEPVPDPDPAPPENGSVTWHVNHGLTDQNGRVIFDGFDSNDVVQYANSYTYVGAQYVDYIGNDSIVDSTLLTFDFTANDSKPNVQVVLVGYIGFTAGQLFHSDVGEV